MASTCKGHEKPFCHINYINLETQQREFGRVLLKYLWVRFEELELRNCLRRTCSVVFSFLVLILICFNFKLLLVTEFATTKSIQQPTFSSEQGAATESRLTRLPAANPLWAP